MNKYEIRPVPPFEDFGGPPNDDPTAFVDLNRPGVDGDWNHDGARLAISLLAGPGEKWKQPVVVAPGRSANGVVNLQIAPDGALHIEYQIFSIDGRKIRPEEHPVDDEQLTAALAQWFEANPDGIHNWVLQHGGELR